MHLKTENKYFLGGADITLAEKCKITLTDVSKLSDRRIVEKVSVQDFNVSVMSVNSPHTAQNMPEYKFYLTSLFPYKDRIFDYALIREHAVQKKHTFFSVI